MYKTFTINNQCHQDLHVRRSITLHVRLSTLHVRRQITVQVREITLYVRKQISLHVRG